MLRILAIVVFTASFSLFAGTPKPPAGKKQDSSWKRYVNAESGYCVNYPSRWARGDAFDGSGMYFATGVKKYTRPTGEMDVAAIPMDSVNEAQAEPVTPVQYLATHLDGLKRFERAQKLEVVDQHETPLVGASALYTKDHYFDPIDNSAWVDEILLAKFGDKMFRFEMECKADQVARFEPIFSYFVQTFRFDCNAKH